MKKSQDILASMALLAFIDIDKHFDKTNNLSKDEFHKIMSNVRQKLADISLQIHIKKALQDEE